MVTVNQAISVSVPKNLERRALLSAEFICASLKMGAQERETIQDKSNFRAIAAKTRRVWFR
jgi:hypothetical protein